MSKLVEIKTKETEQSVEAYINNLPDAQQRADSLQLVAMMQKASGAEPNI